MLRCAEGSTEFADNLFADISKILLAQSQQFSSYIKRKACICLLRLYRKDNDMLEPDVWKKKLAAMFHDRDIGLLTSVIALLMLDETLTCTNDPAFDELHAREMFVIGKALFLCFLVSGLLRPTAHTQNVHRRRFAIVCVVATRLTFFFGFNVTIAGRQDRRRQAGSDMFFVYVGMCFN